MAILTKTYKKVLLVAVCAFVAVLLSARGVTHAATAYGEDVYNDSMPYQGTGEPEPEPNPNPGGGNNGGSSSGGSSSGGQSSDGGSSSGSSSSGEDQAEDDADLDDDLTPATPTNPGTGSPTGTTNLGFMDKYGKSLLAAVSGLLVFAGLLLFIILLARRRKRDDKQPPTTIPPSY